MDEAKLLEQYDMYVEAYISEMQKWNKMEEELGGGFSWEDVNSPLLSFEQFKRDFFQGGVSAIMKSDGGIINELD